MRTKFPITVAAIACLLAFGTATSAESGGKPLTGPRIHADAEVFDFGLTPQEALISHTFWLKNPGTEPAEIQKMVPNCGCTQAPLRDSIIQAGNSIPSEVIMGTGVMLGRIEKHVRIMSNASGRVPALTITAYIVKDTTSFGALTATPRAIKLDLTTQDRPDTARTVPITLKNRSGDPIQVKAVEVPQPYVSLDKTEMTLGPGESQRVNFRIAPSGAAGNMTKSVTFEFSDSARSHLTVPVATVTK